MSKHKKGQVDTGEAERIQQIKRLVVIAMFSDDDLMERFVLKVGNAIDLAYRVGSRASVDIDLSMADDFQVAERRTIQSRIEKNLVATFKPAGYEVIEFTMEEKPAKISADVKDFWGGYVLSFKLIAAAKYAKFAGDSENLRRNAVQIGARGKFEIDISKFEYCVGKSAHTFDNFRIFIYTPAMIVCEKLRAICQQMPEYGPIVHRQRPGSARSRDFVDIYQVIESFQLNLTTPENRPLLRNIFDAKRVPLAFMDALPQYREFHRPDFEAVKATVKAGHVLRDFDFYFDYAVGIWARLKALGNV